MTVKGSPDSSVEVSVLADLLLESAAKDGPQGTLGYERTAAALGIAAATGAAAVAAATTAEAAAQGAIAAGEGLAKGAAAQVSAGGAAGTSAAVSSAGAKLAGAAGAPKVAAAVILKGGSSALIALKTTGAVVVVAGGLTLGLVHQEAHTIQPQASASVRSVAPAMLEAPDVERAAVPQQSVAPQILDLRDADKSNGQLEAPGLTGLTHATQVPETLLPTAKAPEAAAEARALNTKQSFASQIARPVRPKTAPVLPKPLTVSSLEAELELLGRARGLLSQGDLAGCERELELYLSKFRNGALSVEAEVLRMVSLDAGGKKEQARQRARSFLLQRPNTPHRRRLEGILQESKSKSVAVDMD